MTNHNPQPLIDLDAEVTKRRVAQLIAAEFAQDPSRTSKVLAEIEGDPRGQVALHEVLMGALRDLIAELAREGTSEDLLARTGSALSVLRLLAPGAFSEVS